MSLPEAPQQAVIEDFAVSAVHHRIVSTAGFNSAHSYVTCKVDPKLCSGLAHFFRFSAFWRRHLALISGNTTEFLAFLLTTFFCVLPRFCFFERLWKGFILAPRASSSISVSKVSTIQRAHPDTDHFLWTGW